MVEELREPTGLTPRTIGPVGVKDDSSFIIGPVGVNKLDPL